MSGRRLPRAIKKGVQEKQPILHKCGRTCWRHFQFTNQLLLTMAASFGYFTIGLVRGYSSSAVPSIETDDSYIIPSLTAESWISAVPPLGAFMGSLLAAPLMQRIGRRYTLLLSSPLWVLGWALIATSISTEMMITARFMTGVSAGLATPSAQVYVSECSEPEIRGVLGSLPALFMAGGILISYIMGAWLPWQNLAWASAVVPAMFFFMLLPLPESPIWLYGKGRSKEAEDAMRWLLRSTDTPTVELAELKKDMEDRKPFSRAELFRRPVMIPLLLSFALLVFQQISGIDAIIFYTVAIFHSAGSSIEDHLATIIVGLVQLVSNFGALFLIDRAGRRPLLLASGVMMSVSMAALGAYFYLFERHQVENLGFLPLLSLMVFMVGFSIGYCSIPFLLMGELLPEKQRSIFSSFAGSLNLGMMFVVIKTYPDLKHAIGSEGTFWLYSVNCLVSCFFVGFLLPETKGKSLEEIEHYFEQKHVSKTAKQDKEPQQNVKDGDKKDATLNSIENTEAKGT